MKIPMILDWQDKPIIKGQRRLAHIPGQLSYMFRINLKVVCSLQAFCAMPMYIF